MEWITPTTDKTAQSYETYIDFNRQAGNIKYLASVVFPSLGYTAESIDIPEINMYSLPYASLLNKVENNLTNLIASGITEPTGWESSKEWIPGEFAPDYTDTNRWERNALLLYQMAERIKRRWPVSGTFVSGQSSILPRMVI